MCRIIFLFAPVITLALFSCEPVRQQAYYVSPFNANHNAYHPIPMRADSMPAAFYASAAVYTGTANEKETDNVFSVNTNFSGAHNFNIFQAFYSANLSFGNYTINPVSTNSSSSLNATLINRGAGRNSFGGVGLNAGVNAVWTMPRAEWRVIGIETSMQEEFGKYLQFREQLRDSAATYLTRSSSFSTTGLYTEGLLNTGSNITVGLRFSYGWVLGDEYKNVMVRDLENKRLVYNYYKFTFHLTARRFTGYLQSNVSCKATGAFIGFAYRLNNNNSNSKRSTKSS